MPMSAIKIEHLYKTYRGTDRPAVDDLCLTIGEGEFFGLLGANGAGKTTTISILCGLRHYAQGKVEVEGYDVASQMEKIRPLIGVVPQEYALYPELTAAENLKIFGGLYGIDKTDLKARIEELATRLEVEPEMDRRIAHLSGGQKRRFNLMAGLLHRPQILFLDEPTVGIDVKSQQTIIDYLQQLHQGGTTIIYTSHLMAEAENLCTRIGFMNQGKLLATGSPQELIAQNQSESLHDLCLTLIS